MKIFLLFLKYLDHYRKSAWKQICNKVHLEREKSFAYFFLFHFGVPGKVWTRTQNLSTLSLLSHQKLQQNLVLSLVSKAQRKQQPLNWLKLLAVLWVEGFKLFFFFKGRGSHGYAPRYFTRGTGEGYHSA